MSRRATVFLIRDNDRYEPAIYAVFGDKAEADAVVEAANGTGYQPRYCVEAWPVLSGPPTRVTVYWIDVIVIGDRLESLSEARRSVWTWLEPQPSLPEVRTWPAYPGTNLRVEGTDEQAVRETFAAEAARLREAS